MTGEVKVGRHDLTALQFVPHDELDLVTHVNIYLSGLGLSHLDYLEHILLGKISNRILVAITPPAFCIDHRYNTEHYATIPSQADLLVDTICDLHNQLINNLNKSIKIYFYGFSVGGDLLMSMLPKLAGLIPNIVSGAYLADPNVNSKSCTFSSILARSPDPISFLAEITGPYVSRKTSISKDELSLLRDRTTYFSKVVTNNNWKVLREFARDVEIYSDKRFVEFADWVRSSNFHKNLKENCRFHFSESTFSADAVAAGVPKELIVSSGVNSHFRFMETSFLALLQELGRTNKN